MSGKDNAGFQAGDLLLVDSVDIGKDSVLPGRLGLVSCEVQKRFMETYDLLGDVDFLQNGHGTLLQRALDIDLLTSVKVIPMQMD